MTDEEKATMLGQAANFTKAAAKHVSGGMKEVTFEEYVCRLDKCSDCEFRKKNKCTACGCYLPKKAWWKTEDCPKHKWKKQQ